MHKKHANQEKALARCEQVLEAAEKCFIENGFHKASMSDISNAAGMSVGHIYNYFQNKEEIITAIIARQFDSFLEEFRNHTTTKEDQLNALTNHVRKHIVECGDPRKLSLIFDIVAETARNEEMASVVYRYDDHLQKWLQELLRSYQPEMPKEEVSVRVEMLLIILNGITMRLIRNPRISNKQFIDSICRVVTNIVNGEYKRRISEQA